MIKLDKYINMDLNINIQTNGSCSVVIQDTTEYLPEGSTGTVKGKFKYSDTVSVDVLQYNKIHNPYYSNPTYTKHSGENHYTKIPVNSDGWFNVVHLVLPSEEWFKKEAGKTEGSALNLYSIVYYSDGSKVYKYVNGSSQETNLSEVLEINPVNTTISKISKNFVSICFLRKCYINLCQQIFNDRGFSQCQSKNNVDSELVYKRDLVWMAINVIKYLTECEQLYEVERIIESIQGCNGLCPQSNISSKVGGCGCSK